MIRKTVEEAQRELDEEIEEETVKQIELGHGRWKAAENAYRIVRKRREQRASGLIPTSKGN